VQEGSRPAPVISATRTIRTAPAHCLTAQDLGDSVGLHSCFSRTAVASQNAMPEN
jgi:hypothetical protein